MKKEYPILFNYHSVRVILDLNKVGHKKTVTRRLMKPQPTITERGGMEGVSIILPRGVRGDIPFGYDTIARAGVHKARLNPQGAVSVLAENDKWLGIKPGEFFWKSPYGVPGDGLWGRETFAVMCKEADPYCWCETDEAIAQNHYIEYRADTGNKYPGDWDIADNDELDNDYIPKWRPSIHMPRESSRLLLTNKGVSIERVQDIAVPEEVWKEGGYRVKNDPGMLKFYGSSYAGSLGHLEKWAFSCLWDEMHEKPKRAKRNPFTGAKEDCYVSYPWEDIRETRERGGLPWYVIGNPVVFRVEFEEAPNL